MAMRSASMRPWERLSNRRALSIATSAPASMTRAAALWVRAEVEANRKQPVSVAMPVYRQAAISGVMGTASSSSSSTSSSQVAEAVPSTSVS